MNNILTFKFIDIWANKSAKNTYVKIKDSPEQLKSLKEFIEEIKNVKYEENELNELSYTKTFEYGFKIIYGAIIKGGLLLISAWLLNILLPTLVVTASFGIIRVFAGGLHFDSYTKCTYVSLIALLLGGALGKYIPFIMLINIIVFIFTLSMFTSFAPVENKNRPLKEFEKPKFKTIAIINLFFLLVVQCFVDVNIIKESIMFGMLFAGTITLPIVNKLQ